MPTRGGRWRDHLQVIDVIAWKCQTGSPWPQPPERHGSWKDVYARLRNWAIDGTWQRISTALPAQADAGVLGSLLRAGGLLYQFPDRFVHLGRCNANTRHPDVLAAQHKARAHIGSGKGIRWADAPPQRRVTGRAANRLNRQGLSP
ncbi:transposase [Streptomyces sp. CA-250714]|uniref:transposase n=1 Tax=Streptomyces sp. CA-250714 TaxID=3240060 RepID=UPI003D8D5F83